GVQARRLRDLVAPHVLAARDDATALLELPLRLLVPLDAARLFAEALDFVVDLVEGLTLLVGQLALLLPGAIQDRVGLLEEIRALLAELLRGEKSRHGKAL